MTFEEFNKTLRETVPGFSSPYLDALWQDAKGNWKAAHDIIESLQDKNAAWIHAYLHRKEGDIGNAGYWYNRAGKKRPVVTLEKEWEELVTAFL